MSAVTGIELGPDCCALVRAEWRHSTAAVSAARLIAPTEWPHEPYELAQLLNQTRLTARLPRRAHVVVWNGLDPGAPADLARILPLQPFVSAGFEIGGVLSPAQALARIVWQHHGSREQAIAALALNTHGAAIAIVRGEQILYSRRFTWAFGRPFTGKRAELLDRYLLVSQLAPQLQHGIRFVRPVHHAVVTSAVACGNLPELRSLSMLLIQELDLEIETLDSATLLDLPRFDPKTHTQLVESVPALQLACAAASVDSTDLPSHIADDGGAEAVKKASGQPAGHDTSTTSKGSAALRLAAAAALLLAAVWSSSASRTARPIADRAEILRVADATRVADQTDQNQGSRVADRTDQRLGSRVADRTDQNQGARVADQTDRVEATMGRFTERRPPVVEKRSAPVIEKRPVPVPEIEGIVISGENRLALVGGVIVERGDRVGPRAVSRIERDGVVLREPDGGEIFVPVRRKTLPRDP
jgi:hypothetical protein